MMCSNSLSARVVDGSGDDEEEEVACALWGSRTRSARGGATEEREREREREREILLLLQSFGCLRWKRGRDKESGLLLLFLSLAHFARHGTTDGWMDRQTVAQTGTQGCMLRGCEIHKHG